MKRIIIITSLIIVAFIIYNFTTSIYRLWHKQDLLVTAKKDLRKEQKQNAELKKQLAFVKKPEFVEEQARDKLFFLKPGESSIVIPTGVLVTQSAQIVKKTESPHWEEWVKLFLH